MATFSLGNVPSPINQALRLAQLREAQNPNLALERQLQQAIQLQQLQQQSPEGQLAQQLKQAQLNTALQQQAFQQQQQPLILKELEARLQGLQNPNIALEREFNEQLIKSSFDPVSGVRRAGVGAPPTGEIEPIINPITGAETPFVRDFEQRKSNIAKATALKGPTKVGNQLVQLNPTTQQYEVVFGDVKPSTVSRFSDANGFLFNQSTTGGPATPVLDGEGEQINIGVANQVISTDQGVFTLPKKSGGGATTPSTDASGLQPLTGPTGAPLTKTTGRGGATSEAGRALASETARRSIETVDELLPRVDNTTVGLAALTSSIPGSPALNFASDLSQLAANIRIGALQEMRNASKTGGAFGNVSNQEGRVLESTLGSLEQKQSPPQMRSNLNKIKASLQRYEEAKQKYGTPATSGGPPNIKTKAEFDKLPSGSQYVGPSGAVATKP